MKRYQREYVEFYVIFVLAVLGSVWGISWLMEVSA